MQRIIPFISDLVDYFKQPEAKLFRHGDRIRIDTKRLFFKGGLSNTVGTTKIGSNVVLIYRDTKDNHYHFDVAVNKEVKAQGLKTGDRVFISTLTFEGLDYEKI